MKHTCRHVPRRTCADRYYSLHGIVGDAAGSDVLRPIVGTVTDASLLRASRFGDAHQSVDAQRRAAQKLARTATMSRLT